MTAVSDQVKTPVSIGVPRGGPAEKHLRSDRWWLQPLVTFTILTGFIVYSTWAVFQNANYYVGASLQRNLLSPFYSPCIANGCPQGSQFSFVAHWWTLSPGILILVFPLGFRLTCYYYRKAYYRSFWLSPPACAIEDKHKNYSGETRFPLILQNAHRWFMYCALVFNVLLTIDAVEAFRMGSSGWGMSLGTLVLCANALFLWLYSVSCHACRHLCGGGVNRFSEHPLRYRLWKVASKLNKRHMQFAWLSLVFVALTDVYVRLVASGAIHDPRFF